MRASAGSLAIRWRRGTAHGIRVNIVAPGLVDTDMGQRLMNALQGLMTVRWTTVCLGALSAE